MSAQECRKATLSLRHSSAEWLKPVALQALDQPAGEGRVIDAGHEDVEQGEAGDLDRAANGISTVRRSHTPGSVRRCVLIGGRITTLSKLIQVHGLVETVTGT